MSRTGNVVVVKLYLMADVTGEELERRVADLLENGTVRDAFNEAGLDWNGYGDVKALVGCVEVDDGDDTAGATEPGRGSPE